MKMPLFAQRLWAWLAQPEATRRMAWLVPLAAGLISVALGQDANWDLRNYHRYNPYALLNGRIGVDLAPGQWQGYFNPALDLLYHGLNAVFPAPVAGFAMGVLHGLNFVLVLCLARCLVAGVRAPILLALAGCLGAGFLSELGNTMGDNMTALFVLSALALLLPHWDRLTLRRIGAAGLLAGLGTGLKLTNAMYALAMCLALLTVAGGVLARVRAAFVYGLGVLAGIGASAGFWYWTMWQVFGNPLFPQFNNIFKAPLAAPVGIGDTSWLPVNLAEKLLWPFIFTLHPARVIELPMRQLIWPVVYVLFIALAATWLLRLMRPGPAAPMDMRARFLLLFFALSYLIWVNLFAIYRYLVPVELLAPLVVWLLLHRMLPAARAARVAGRLLALTAVVVFPVVTWGHARWHREAFRAEVPVFAAPAQSLVFIVHGDPPMGWYAPFFPSEVVLVSIGAGFPESPAYHARMRALVAARTGTHYVMFAHIGKGDEARQAAAADTVTRYGFVFDAASCRDYRAWMGKQLNGYRLCEVKPGR
ncbi:MAG: hypothetical protein ACLGI6_14465 [Gammaproteobacteria bacterium]